MRSLIASMVLLACACASARAAPPIWKVDPAHSAITVNGFMNMTHKPQSAVFEKWSAQIAFDPNDLSHSSVVVAVATSSIRTGNSDLDRSILPDPDWLGEERFPTATFAAKSFTAQGGGKYEAKGVLTLKGVSFPMTLPFTLAIHGAAADMKGAAPLDLDVLGVGKQNDPKREYAAKAIRVDVAVHATRG